MQEGAGYTALSLRLLAAHRKGEYCIIRVIAGRHAAPQDFEEFNLRHEFQGP
jgi:hypothetical protein